MDSSPSLDNDLVMASFLSPISLASTPLPRLNTWLLSCVFCIQNHNMSELEMTMKFIFLMRKLKPRERVSAIPQLTLQLVGKAREGPSQAWLCMAPAPLISCPLLKTEPSGTHVLTGHKSSFFLHINSFINPTWAHWR